MTESRLDGVRSLGIRNGAIAAISEKSLRGKSTLDAKDCIVAPGFIDLHAHGQQLPAARMLSARRECVQNLPHPDAAQNRSGTRQEVDTQRDAVDSTNLRVILLS